MTLSCCNFALVQALRRSQRLRRESHVRQARGQGRNRVTLTLVAIAISFTIYGVIRKRVVIGGMPGLFIETLILVPFAASWLVWAIWTQQAQFGTDGPGLNAMLLLAGPITVIPLLLFALAARRVPLSTLGFMQFIGPTLQFIVGLVYGETLSTAHLICFSFVWLGVIVFSIDAVRASRQRNRTARIQAAAASIPKS